MNNSTTEDREKLSGDLKVLEFLKLFVVSLTKFKLLKFYFKNLPLISSYNQDI
jgi:hypothetical protein